jgi:glyoxylase-like metal-dependent hydrolase (beta-lactamase superfamily II)
LKTISEQIDGHKLTLLFDTHWHFDHIGCNETLGAGGTKTPLKQPKRRGEGEARADADD